MPIDPTTPLTCMSVNAWRSAQYTPEGAYDNRLPELCDSIRAHAPQLVGFQEVSLWAHNDYALMHEAADRLSLSPVQRSFVEGQSTGLMYDPDAMELVRYEPVSGREIEFQGFTGTAVFDVGLPYRIAVVVVHFSHQSAPKALHQASQANDRARRCSDARQKTGKPRAESAVMFGDVNQPELEHPDATVPRPQDLPAANLAYRFKGMPGAETVDRDVATLLARTRWTDVALDAAQRTTDTAERSELLRATGAGGFRVDRVYVTESVAGAVSGYARVPIPSDHDALVWTLTPALIDPSATTQLHR